VNVVEEVLRSTRADVLYTHAPKDSHQDHVATATSALAASRRLNRVLCFQSPSTTGFEPTVFVDVERTMTVKIESLLAHRSQVMRCEMVDLEAVEASSRYWGHRARMLHAEAFESPRFAWDIGGLEIPAARQDPDGDQAVDNVVTPLRRAGRAIASSE
jgi:LmbE family N-acetylglucosaminyl deacetylase